jgi:hypothetical protein
LPENSTPPLGAFIVGILLGRNLGLGTAHQVQWASLLMALGLSPASIVLVTDFARQEASSQRTDGAAQLLDMTRQTNETVGQVQQLSQEAAAAAEVAAQQGAEARQSMDVFGVRLEELEQRARADTAQLQQSIAALIEAVRKLQNSAPQSPATASGQEG